MKKSFWVLIVLAILIVLFAVQNASAVEFNFLSWTSNISLAVLLVITFIAGVLFGAAYTLLAKRSKNKKDLNVEVGDSSLTEESSDSNL